MKHVTINKPVWTAPRLRRFTATPELMQKLGFSADQIPAKPRQDEGQAE